MRAQEKSDDRHASAAPRSTASDAERLATLSRSDLPLDVSLLLAAEAVRLDDTPDTHGQLMAALGGLGRVERVVPFDGVPGEPALSGRGRTLTFRAGDSIVVWSAASELQPHVLIPLPGDWGAWTIASPSPVDAVVVGAGENLAGPWLRTVSTADGASHLIAEGAQLKGRPVDAAVSADGRRVLVLVAEPDGETRSNTTRWRVLDVDLADGTRRETGISGVFPAPPDDLAGDFADDAGSLVVWDAAGTVPATLIDLASGRRTPVAAHSRRAVSTEFRALPSGAVRLWDDGVISRIDSRGTTVQNLIFHVGQVRDVVAPPGANWAVTVGDGGWVVRWDVDPTSGVWGRPERLSGHGGSVIGAEADPDGQRLYTVSLDGRVITWDMRDLGGIEGDRALRMPFMDTEAALAEACAVVGRDLTRAEWAQYLPGRPWQRTCSQNQWEVALGLAGDHRGHGTG